MDQICEYCQAYHFIGELPQDKKYSICCHKGKVQLPKLKEYPNELFELITGKHALSKHFKDNFRIYNCSSSFASFGEVNGRKTVENRGPYCYTIHGQVYHCTSSLYPNTKNTESFAQLYVLDPKIALQRRKERPENSGMYFALYMVINLLFGIFICVKNKK